MSRGHELGGMSETKRGERQRLKSVRRSFDVIEFLRTDGPATLSEIATAFDMPMSTAYVYLSTLVETRYVTETDGQYECSLRFLQTGSQLRNELPLYQAAKRELDELREAVDEHAVLGTEQNEYMVQLYKSESPASIDDRAPEGSHHPLHATAIGKAILSTWSEEDVDEFVREQGLPAETPNTITDRETLVTELAGIRERGYSVNDAEHHQGVRAVATPIVPNEGTAVGAIAISGPSSRIDEDRIDEEITPKLFHKKNIIELKL